MNEMIIELAQARKIVSDLEETKKSMLEDAIANIPGYANLLEEIAKVKEEVTYRETMIRDEADRIFAETGSKKPHEAVQVKMFTIVRVSDEEKAREWCFSSFRPALKMDMKVFEKAVKDGNIPSDLATCEQEPRTQIATDLSKYL